LSLVPAADPSGYHRHLPPAARLFVGAVSIIGTGTLVALSVESGVRAFIGAPASLWVFAVLVLIGEAYPIVVPREGEVEEIGLSTTFGFAILLAYGAAAAALVFAVATAVADLARRKQAWKALFNVGQYTLSVAAAGLVYRLAGSPEHISLDALGPIAASGAAFFVVNDVLTGTALALAQRLPVLRYLLDDALYQATTAAALIAMAPAVLILADRSPFLVPLLLLPVAAVYWGASAALENTRLVRQLEDALEHEKDLSHLKDDFVAVVSHELRTPLTSIQGYIKTVLQLSGELGKEQQRSFLEAADRQSERLRRLIEQLLAVSRLESHVEPLSLALVSLDQLTRRVVDELRPRAHGNTFDLRFTANLPLVETDEAKVHQILSNLVENALKYSSPDTRVTIRGVGSGNGVALSVEDEGPGIPPESQGRVFERFFQVDSSATRNAGGTGLGLYICAKLSETIGARVWLERSTPEGSVFSLWIPESPPGDDPTAGRPAESRQEPRAQSMTASV